MRKLGLAWIWPAYQGVGCVAACPQTHHASSRKLCNDTAVILSFELVLYCAGFYGTSESQTFSEASSSGRDYLAEVCRDWENEAQRAKCQRTVIFRTGDSLLSACVRCSYLRIKFKSRHHKVCRLLAVVTFYSLRALRVPADEAGTELLNVQDIVTSCSLHAALVHASKFGTGLLDVVRRSPICMH